jgi:hypothetical protein
MVPAMSEEQLKAAAAEATEQEGVEEISEEDLEGVAGGVSSSLGANQALMSNGGNGGTAGLF